MRLFITLVSLLLLTTVTISGVSAYHSYLLTVQQLRTGLTKGRHATDRDGGQEQQTGEGDE